GGQTTSAGASLRAALSGPPRYPRCAPAVDVEDVPGDEPRIIRREEERHRRDVRLGVPAPPDPPGRHRLREPLRVARRVVLPALGPRAGRDGIGSDPLPAPLARGGARERRDACLGRVVLAESDPATPPHPRAISTSRASTASASSGVSRSGSMPASSRRILSSPAANSDSCAAGGSGPRPTGPCPVSRPASSVRARATTRSGTPARRATSTPY